MDYIKLYDAIINNAKTRDHSNIENIYTENHHVIPKSLGGTDTSENIVTLTAREHFLCHYLLCRIHKEDYNSYKKMVYAFRMMKANPSNNNSRYYNSRLYANYKEASSKFAKEDQGEMIWVTNGKEEKRIRFYDDIETGWKRGRTRNWDGHSEESKNKISAAGKKSCCKSGDKTKIKRK